MSLLDACSQGGRWGGGSKTHAAELFFFAFVSQQLQGLLGDFTVLSCYNLSKVMWKIVNRRSNGFIGPRVIHKHINTCTHFTRVRLAWWYILIYMHAKVDLNCDEFVPLGSFVS